MFFHEGMSPRQSMVHELLDTLHFGNLDRLKGGLSYKKVKTAENQDAYMVPFAKDKNCFGAILVHSLRRIEVFYNVKGRKSKEKCPSLYDTKKFMVKAFLAD